jgi:hypothetical protein
MFERMPQSQGEPEFLKHFITHAKIRASGWNPRNAKELREYLRIQRMSDEEVERGFTEFMRKVQFNTP